MKKKIISIVLSAAMVLSMSAVGAFASDGDATTSYTSEDGITLIGAAPFAGATNVAPGGGKDNPIQPIRIALSDSVDEVVANLNDADVTNDYIKVTNGTTQLAVTASPDGDIVVLTPASAMANKTTYNVSFSGILSGISGYSFTTSQGGTGGGGGTGTGGGGGNQALTLTGQIPFGEMNADGTVASAMTVSEGQNLYAVFSNSLLPGPNYESEEIPDLEAYNEAQIRVTDATGNTVAGCTVDIIDSWTVKVSTPTTLGEGSYRLVINNSLMASNGRTYAGKTIPFNIA